MTAAVHRIAPRIHCAEDRRHTREAVRAIALDRRTGRVWDAYAHCDRAPFGWERGGAAPPAPRRVALTPAQWTAVMAAFWVSALAAVALAGIYHRRNQQAPANG